MDKMYDFRQPQQFLFQNIDYTKTETILNFPKMRYGELTLFVTSYFCLQFLFGARYENFKDAFRNLETLFWSLN